MSTFESVHTPFLGVSKFFERPLNGLWIKADEELSTVPKPVAKCEISRFRHYLGYGPYGFHTINNRVEQAAATCIHFLVTSLKIPEQLNRIEELSLDEKQRIKDAIKKIHEIQQSKWAMQDKIRKKFYPIESMASKFLWLIALFFETLRQPSFWLSNWFRKSRFERQLGSEDIYRIMRRLHDKPYLICQTKQGTLQLFFNPAQKQLQIIKGRKCSGTVSFYINNEKPVLQCTDDETQNLFTKFLLHMRTKKLTSQPYDRTENEGRLRFYQTLLDDEGQNMPHPRIELILDALSKFKEDLNGSFL